MQKKQTVVRNALIVAGVIGLAACGGGSSSTSGSGSTLTSTTSPAPTQIGGTAASGAPFAGATVTLTDANGTQKTITAAADGSYVFDAKGMTAPFVISATGMAGGTTTTYVAVMADVLNDGDTRTLNVTPLTTAVAALLSDANDPLDMLDSAKLKAKATPAEIGKAVTAIRTVLANVVTATGADASTFDPMTTAFKANRTGLDSVLDAIKVSLSGQGVVLTNAFAPIPESAAALGAAAAPSVALTKTNLATPPAPLVAPTIDMSSIAAILDSWRDQLNGCFAQAAADRVTLSGGAVTGVKGACAQVSGFNPNYKSNGYTLFQTYGDLLSDPAMDGAKFGIPDFLTLIKTDTGADLAVFRLDYKRSDGDTNHVLDVAQKVAVTTATSSGWSVVGNQRDYDASVQARFDRIVDLKNGGKVGYSTGLRLFFNPLGPNASDVNVVRVSGPGLPAAGVVLGKSDACGTASYLQIQNKTGSLTSVVPAYMRTASSFFSWARPTPMARPSTGVRSRPAPIGPTCRYPISRPCCRSRGTSLKCTARLPTRRPRRCSIRALPQRRWRRLTVQRCNGTT
ncbi:carboxypeptidase-like regulatory domain-containing protein [Undibacterium arcticum]